MDLVTQVPRMSKEEFEAILNSNMQVRLQRHTLYTIRFAQLQAKSSLGEI